MATTPIHTKKYAEVWNSITIPSATADFQIQRDEAEVTTSAEDDKAFLPGKAGATGNSAGPADFAAAGGVATLWDGILAGTEATRTLLPDGDSAISATNPSATESAFQTSFTLSLDQGNAAQYSTAFRYADAPPERDITP